MFGFFFKKKTIFFFLPVYRAYMQIPGDRDGTAAVSFRLLSDPVSRTLKWKISFFLKK